MNRLRLTVAAILSAVATVPLQIAAWNTPTHMVTGSIAYWILENESPRTVSIIKTLLEKHPWYADRWRDDVEKLPESQRSELLFMLAARWADDIRTRDRAESHPPWHYINWPFKPEGEPANVEVRPPQQENILTALAPELDGKRLELLKEVVPGLSRLAVILNPTNPVSRPELQGTQDAARGLRLQTEPILEVTDLNSLDQAFTKLKRDRIRAFVLLTDPIFFSIRGQIVEHALKSRLPAVYVDSAFPDAGGLMSYGPNIPDLYRRAAMYVDKILKGTKPVDLPVEQPTKFELVINLKVAKQIGLTIPPNVLARSDRVIK